MEGVEQEASIGKSGSLAELTVMQSVVALDGLTEEERSSPPDHNFPHITEDTKWVQDGKATSSELQELSSTLGEKGESKEAKDDSSVQNGEKAEKDKQQENSSSTVTTSTCPGK